MVFVLPDSDKHSFLLPGWTGWTDKTHTSRAGNSTCLKDGYSHPGAVNSDDSIRLQVVTGFRLTYTEDGSSLADAQRFYLLICQQQGRKIPHIQPATDRLNICPANPGA